MSAAEDSDLDDDKDTFSDLETCSLMPMLDVIVRYVEIVADQGVCDDRACVEPMD